MILFSGVVEFGFILNYYLSLLDATREAARLYSNGDPATDPNFFNNTAVLVVRLLDPKSVDPNSSYEGRRIILDKDRDDVIVSVYSVSDSDIVVYPSDSADPTSGAYRLLGHYDPIFSATDIASRLITDSPNAGILMVEVHYNYHHVLGLPWFSFADPIPLRAYTIMPMRAAEPPDVP
jgi:hypothetical protein